MKIELGKEYLRRDGERVRALDYDDEEPDLPWEFSDGVFRSDDGFGFLPRASEPTDIVAEAPPKLWGDMTREEKGALLLEWHEGKVREFYDAEPGEWLQDFDLEIEDELAYRARPEPNCETVTLSGHRYVDCTWGFSTSSVEYDTHRILFDLIDGEPDCASIRMEKIQ